MNNYYKPTELEKKELETKYNLPVTVFKQLDVNLQQKYLNQKLTIIEFKIQNYQFSEIKTFEEYMKSIPYLVIEKEMIVIL